MNLGKWHDLSEPLILSLITTDGKITRVDACNVFAIVSKVIRLQNFYFLLL